ncbi:MAG: colanic acid biosynthesis glycosyltransferase WcaL [Peptococcaceae bacterium]|jgi:glycosyltransferase involved in cell wall biosynthesis|nr:MAG: colanic acid biosynthesis glycosyltransferase WcaL [Peptococcaceae bacterium]
MSVEKKKSMRKVMYITVSAPFGRAETFLIPEMLALLRLGVKLAVAPVRPARRVFHAEGRALAVRSLRAGWLALAGAVFFWLVRAPARVLRLLAEVFCGAGWPNNVKNVLVFPKALFMARRSLALQVEHIHAHWASTPSTCAMIVSKLTGVPWSFTAHRWDIECNNMLAGKVRSALFVRAISRRGRGRIAGLAGDALCSRIVHIPMGVEVPGSWTAVQRGNGRDAIAIAAAGRLVELKGHRYLIRACRLLAGWGINFNCTIIGEGPLRAELERLAGEPGLGGRVWLAGELPHERLIGLLRERAFDLLVHPSITVPGGEEGVPVVVMEAMARGVPVVTTATGGIPELAGGGAALLVPPRDPAALALAILRLAADEALAAFLSRRAYEKVRAEYNLERNSARLLELMG